MMTYGMISQSGTHTFNLVYIELEVFLDYPTQILGRFLNIHAGEISRWSCSLGSSTDMEKERTSVIFQENICCTRREIKEYHNYQ